MTKNQLELLCFIRDYIHDNGFAPSFHEMSLATGRASKSHVFRLLRALEEQGQIVRLRNRARAIEIPVSPCMPRDLTVYRLEDIVREVNRRGLVMGHMHRDADNRRTFKEIKCSVDTTS